MSLIVDCHVHLYPAFNEEVLFAAALRNLAAIAPKAHKVLLLVERRDCDRFVTLHSGSLRSTAFEIAAVDDISIRVSSKLSGDSLLVVAGRQIATVERLEVLSWCATAKVPDGLTLQETISAVRRAGGVPALAWAPGKWTGARSALVRSVLADQTCRPLMLCDTTLRPIGWPIPNQFMEAARLQVAVMAGTDPLPMAGEEAHVGRYGMFIEADEGPATGERLRAILAASPTQSATRGRRNGPFRWLIRYSSFMLGNR